MNLMCLVGGGGFMVYDVINFVLDVCLKVMFRESFGRFRFFDYMTKSRTRLYGIF